MRPVRYNLRQYLCMACASFLLVGCSYFDTQGGAQVEHVEAIDLTAEQEPVYAAPPTMGEIVNRSSRGRVELYSLDGVSSGGATPLNPDYVLPKSSSPKVSTGDPSVEIYPLDDRMGALVKPSIMPPSSARPMLPSPFESSGVELSPEFVQVSSSTARPAQIYFDHDSSKLDGEDMGVIDAIVSGYKSGARGVISVVGHSSKQSSNENSIQRKIVNLRISMLRAFEVAKALIEGGIPAESIETKAYGETHPAAQGSEAENRRVEILPVSSQ